MTTHLRTAAATAGLLAMLSVPAAAWAAFAWREGVEELADALPSGGDGSLGIVDGILALTIYPGGIVQGTYSLADQGGFRGVSGGLKGDRIWLDIGGGMHAMQVSGTFRDGVLDTVVIEAGPDIVHFRSVAPASRS